MSQRKQFIRQFFKSMTSVEYVLLKFIEGKMDDIDPNSDLDLLVEPATIPTIKSVIQKHDEVAEMEVMELISMHQIFVFFKDGDFLQIDCLFRLVRKEFVYLTNAYIRKNIVEIDKVKTYNNATLFEHVMLFHLLNYDGMPEKYINYFKALPELESADILKSFNKKYGIALSLKDLSFKDTIRMKVVDYLKKQPENSSVARTENYVSYLGAGFSRLRNSRGRIITFSGVDGAGKSTILAATKTMLEKKFRKKVVVLRHRPSILPILSSVKYGKQEAEKRAAEKMPRQGDNTSKLNSMLRFSYYYVDYIFGQWYIYFKYLLSDHIVLYDRYYFDFIVDGKRSNINVDSKIAKLLYKFVHKPILNFFLYAPAEVILARKKELTANDIESLTTNYQDLFKNFSGQYAQKYLPIKNLDKTSTLHLIQKEIQAIL